MFYIWRWIRKINIKKLIEFHNSHGKLATVTATRPPARFGALKFGQDSTIIGFQEKPEGDGSWINGGFFVLSPEVIKFISGDECTWENEPLINLAKNGELLAYKHFDFWQPMDTLREKNFLNQLWKSGKAPWKVWN